MSSAAYDAILKTAQRLFYAYGSWAVGVDRIILESRVAKATFYRHFPSKDDLIHAVLTTIHAEAMASMPAAAERLARRSGESAALCLFDVLQRWFESETFNGCVFVRAALERPEDDRVRAIAAGHKLAIEAWLAGTLEREGLHVAEAHRAAAALMLLYDGAIVRARLEYRPDVAMTAKATARALLENSIGMTREAVGAEQ